MKSKWDTEESQEEKLGKFCSMLKPYKNYMFGMGRDFIYSC